MTPQVKHSPDDVRGFGPETNAPPPKVTIGSLFSGIGGLELGLELALGDGGFDVETIWQCERDEWCRGILARHWPAAVCYDDVRAVGADAPRVDVLCGGFPCQDVSVAGKGAGLAGERSGLWGEFARVARDLRPRILVVENVSALACRGIGTVLGDISEAGHDAVWFDLRASDVGAPHRRERIFIVAWRRDVGHSDGGGRGAQRIAGVGAEVGRRGAHPVAATTPANTGALATPRRLAAGGVDRPWVGGSPDGLPRRLDIIAHEWPAKRGTAQPEGEPPRATPQPPSGSPSWRERKRRLMAYGNAVAPQCGYAVGCVVAAIMNIQNRTAADSTAAYGSHSGP